MKKRGLSFAGSLGVAFLGAIFWTVMVGLCAIGGFYSVIGKSAGSVYSAIIIAVLLTFPVIVMELVAEFVISKFPLRTTWRERNVIALRFFTAGFLCLLFIFWVLVLADFERNSIDMLQPLEWLTGSSIELSLNKAIYITFAFAFLSRFLTWIPVRRDNVTYVGQGTPRSGFAPSVKGSTQ